MTRSEDIALAPRSQLTSRASASTDHSNGMAQNTGSSVSANDVPSIKPDLQPTDGFHPMEMDAPQHGLGNEPFGRPTELR